MKKGYEIGLPLMSFSVHCYICNFKLLLKILFEINYFWIIFYKMLVWEIRKYIQVKWETKLQTLMTKIMKHVHLAINNSMYW